MDYLLPCLLFVWVAYFWDTYLEWRQRQVYRMATSVPAELTGLLDQETFDKSRSYQQDKSSFSMAHQLFKQIEFLVIILLGFLPFAWNVSGAITAHFGYGSEYEVSQTVVFLLLCLVYSTVVEMPWGIYSTFVLEEKHGFNKQTARFFIKDKVKAFILSSILLPLILSGLIFVIQWGGEYFYIYAWLFLFVVSLTFIMVYHDYIAPLFDKYTPLPEGELRSSIESLASSLAFPLKKILVVEGSKRSAHSNAYFYGFWKNKRIVLFDTLLEGDVVPKKEGVADQENKEGVGDQESKEDAGDQESKEDAGDQESKEDTADQESIGAEEGAVKDEIKTEGSETEEEVKDELLKEEKKKKKKKGCSNDEVLAVLAHELGHWKFSHNLKNIFIAEVNLFLTLFMFGFFLNQQDVYTSFGFPDSRPTVIGLIIVFELIFTPYNEVFQFLIVQVVRRCEYQADTFAKSLRKGSALRSALTKLHKDNLSFPIADPLFSAFRHSHPTYLERMRALAKED